MRAIKFRAWDKLENCMRYFKEDECLRFSDFEDTANHWSEPMQFTGLLDKNGKEIYEGDILKHYNDLHVIHWDEHIAGFSWRTCSMDIYLMFRKFVAENCEVVGNIYSNPELLEGVK